MRVLNSVVWLGQLPIRLSGDGTFSHYALSILQALAWHPFHKEYFVSGSFYGSIFHWLFGHDTPQVEITGACMASYWLYSVQW
ncbi:hypothetical protein MKW92_009805 [Papaver armeniacum]|nr:hypothetical protein MKW92_009805 [Papaver armeniacum]